MNRGFRAEKDSLEFYADLFRLKSNRFSLKSLEISQFWTEKLLILFSAIQLFALCYAAGYNIWPNYWISIVDRAGLSMFAGDLATLLYEDISQSETGRLIYMGAWLGIIGGLILLYMLSKLVLLRSVVLRVQVERYLFYLLVILYLPIALALLPQAICRFDNCWDVINPGQVILLVLSICACVLVLGGFPVYIALRTYANLVTSDSEDHENYLQLKEIEYILQVSVTWIIEKYYLFSSFRRSWLRVYYHAIYQCTVAALVLVHTLLNTEMTSKLLIMGLICLGMAIYVSVFPTYRCFSSYFLHITVWWIITFDFFLACGKSYSYESEVLVDANMTTILATINLSGLLLLFFVMALSLLFCLKWPSSQRTVKQLMVRYRFLLIDLRNAQRMIMRLRILQNHYFVHSEPIAGMIELLGRHYQLLYNEKHFLQYTVLEQMEELGFLMGLVKAQSLLPCKRLESDLELVTMVIKRRWGEQCLMSRKKRQILLKLFFLRWFTKGVKTGPWLKDMNVPEAYLASEGFRQIITSEVEQRPLAS